MKKSHIYTRGGDTGTTSLIGGCRIKKCDLRIEAYGTLDELSSHIGLLASMVTCFPDDDAASLGWIQSRLFDAGTHLATPCTDEVPSPCTITALHVERLEHFIDMLDSSIPPLRTFILPGGCVAASQCHVCRTVCRRAERLIVALSEETPVAPIVPAFINRLSDFFFVYARFINKNESADEISWKNDCD